jgi:hypothetical protein
MQIELLASLFTRNLIGLYLEPVQPVPCFLLLCSEPIDPACRKAVPNLLLLYALAVSFELQGLLSAAFLSVSLFKWHAYMCIVAAMYTPSWGRCMRAVIMRLLLPMR